MESRGVADVWKQRAKDAKGTQRGWPRWEGVTSSQHVALRAAQPQLHLRVRKEAEGWLLRVRKEARRCWPRLLRKQAVKRLWPSEPKRRCGQCKHIVLLATTSVRVRFCVVLGDGRSSQVRLMLSEPSKKRHLSST